MLSAGQPHKDVCMGVKSYAAVIQNCRECEEPYLSVNQHLPELSLFSLEHRFFLRRLPTGERPGI
jgi:hypothetical protein